VIEEKLLHVTASSAGLLPSEIGSDAELQGFISTSGQRGSQSFVCLFVGGAEDTTYNLSQTSKQRITWLGAVRRPARAVSERSILDERVICKAREPA
jgi:hypothetical protein